MKTLHHAILSPSWVWIWFYDEFKTKHFKELFDQEAEDFIQNL